MEASGGTNSEPYVASSPPTSSNTTSRRQGMQFPAMRFFQAPVSTILEYSGILGPRSGNPQTEGFLTDNSTFSGSAASRGRVVSNGDGEVSIRIIGAAEQDRAGDAVQRHFGENDETITQISGPSGFVSMEDGNRSEIGDGERGSGADSSFSVNSRGGDAGNAGSSDSVYQRYDIQQVARWVEQVLPFSLLLLIVFIRQHLQGFFVAIWITLFLFKSNDILRKQTALKGERKISVVVGYCVVFMLHLFGIYWWYRNDDIFYPLLVVPPKEIPNFWRALFTILVNDTMARQAAMALKLVLLMYYKNGRGHNYRRQGQMLTLVEYTLLLYRALLPTPVWYRFFLNKEYGSHFSSLITGLYLTFKLTSIVEKVQSFFAALKSLSRKELHYGSYATSEQVIAAGDLCAICQEKMHAPILLRCKHIFCEDCASEWFERERTCPLCRALVRPADLRSYGDGSTSLFLQLF